MITAYVTKLNEGENNKIKAYLTIDIDNLIKINNCRYIVSDKGEFVGMPCESFTNQNGDVVYKETVQVLDNVDFRNLILNAAKQAYQNYIHTQDSSKIVRPNEPSTNAFGDPKYDGKTKTPFAKYDPIHTFHPSI